MRDYTKIKDRSKISPQEQPNWDTNIRIARDHIAGTSYSKLAKKYNLTSSRIGQIVRTWKPFVLAQE